MRLGLSRLGLSAALGAALAFGVASILQARAAAGTVAGARPQRGPAAAHAAGPTTGLPGGGRAQPRRLRPAPVALRALPLFLAQVAIAASVAVTAVLAVLVLRVRLGAAGWAAVGAVCAGLALVAGSAGPAGQNRAGTDARAFVLVAVLGVAVLGLLVGRVAGCAGVVLLGLVAGLGFGLVSVAARLLPSLAVGAVLADAATYALLAAGADRVPALRHRPPARLGDHGDLRDGLDPDRGPGGGWGRTAR